MAAAAAGAAVGASRNDDADQQATGAAATRAREAALKLYPGGTVRGIERDVEGRRVWEVELRRADGSTVDVDLDGGLRRLAAERDDPERAREDRGEDRDDRGEDREDRAEDRDDRGDDRGDDESSDED